MLFLDPVSIRLESHFDVFRWLELVRAEAAESLLESARLQHNSQYDSREHCFVRALMLSRTRTKDTHWFVYETREYDKGQYISFESSVLSKSKSVAHLRLEA